MGDDTAHPDAMHTRILPLLGVSRPKSMDPAIGECRTCGAPFMLDLVSGNKTCRSCRRAKAQQRSQVRHPLCILPYKALLNLKIVQAGWDEHPLRCCDVHLEQVVPPGVTSMPPTSPPPIAAAAWPGPGASMLVCNPPTLAYTSIIPHWVDPALHRALPLLWHIRPGPLSLRLRRCPTPPCPSPWSPTPPRNRWTRPWAPWR